MGTRIDVFQKAPGLSAPFKGASSGRPLILTEALPLADLLAQEGISLRIIGKGSVDNVLVPPLTGQVLTARFSHAREVVVPYEVSEEELPGAFTALGSQAFVRVSRDELLLDPMRLKAVMDFAKREYEAVEGDQDIKTDTVIREIKLQRLILILDILCQRKDFSSFKPWFMDLARTISCPSESKNTTGAKRLRNEKERWHAALVLSAMIAHGDSSVENRLLKEKLQGTGSLEDIQRIMPQILLRELDELGYSSQAEAILLGRFKNRSCLALRGVSVASAEPRIAEGKKETLLDSSKDVAERDPWYGILSLERTSVRREGEELSLQDPKTSNLDQISSWLLENEIDLAIPKNAVRFLKWLFEIKNDHSIEIARVVRRQMKEGELSKEEVEFLAEIDDLLFPSECLLRLREDDRSSEEALGLAMKLVDDGDLAPALAWWGAVSANLEQDLRGLGILSLSENRDAIRKVLLAVAQKGNRKEFFPGEAVSFSQIVNSLEGIAVNPFEKRVLCELERGENTGKAISSLERLWGESEDNELLLMVLGDLYLRACQEDRDSSLLDRSLAYYERLQRVSEDDHTDKIDAVRELQYQDGHLVAEVSLRDEEIAGIIKGFSEERKALLLEAYQVKVFDNGIFKTRLQRGLEEQALADPRVAALFKGADLKEIAAVISGLVNEVKEKLGASFSYKVKVKGKGKGKKKRKSQSTDVRVDLTSLDWIQEANLLKRLRKRVSYSAACEGKGVRQSLLVWVAHGRRDSLASSSLHETLDKLEEQLQERDVKERMGLRAEFFDFLLKLKPETLVLEREKEDLLRKIGHDTLEEVRLAEIENLSPAIEEIVDMADSLATNGRIEEALSFLEAVKTKVAADKALSVVCHRTIAAVYIEKAFAGEISREELFLAEKLVKKILEDAPEGSADNLLGLRYLGEIFILKGDLQKTATIIANAVSLFDGIPHLLAEVYARATYLMGNRQEAEKMVDQVLVATDHNFDFYFRFVRFFSRSGDQATAARYMNQFFKIKGAEIDDTSFAKRMESEMAFDWDSIEETIRLVSSEYRHHFAAVLSGMEPAFVAERAKKFAREPEALVDSRLNETGEAKRKERLIAWWREASIVERKDISLTILWQVISSIVKDYNPTFPLEVSSNMAIGKAEKIQELSSFHLVNLTDNVSDYVALAFRYISEVSGSSFSFEDFCNHPKVQEMIAAPMVRVDLLYQATYALMMAGEDQDFQRQMLQELNSKVDALIKQFPNLRLRVLFPLREAAKDTKQSPFVRKELRKTLEPYRDDLS